MTDISANDERCNILATDYFMFNSFTTVIVLYLDKEYNFYLTNYNDSSYINNYISIRKVLFMAMVETYFLVYNNPNDIGYEFVDLLMELLVTSGYLTPTLGEDDESYDFAFNEDFLTREVYNCLFLNTSIIETILNSLDLLLNSYNNETLIPFNWGADDPTKLSVIFNREG